MRPCEILDRRKVAIENQEHHAAVVERLRMPWLDPQRRVEARERILVTLEVPQRLAAIGMRLKSSALAPTITLQTASASSSRPARYNSVALCRASDRYAATLDIDCEGPS